MKSSTPSRSRRTVQEDKVFAQPGPKYMDIDQIRPIYGLTRGVIYPLLKAGLIRSACIVGTDAKGNRRSRGKRLIEVASLEAYLAGLTK